MIAAGCRVYLVKSFLVHLVANRRDEEFEAESGSGISLQDNTEEDPDLRPTLSSKNRSSRFRAMANNGKSDCPKANKAELNHLSDLRLEHR